MKVIVAGDFSPHDRLEGAFPSGALSQVKPVLESADYSIVNFESCVDGKDESVKYGCHLKCDSSAVEALAGAGFNCLTLANNHFRDYGAAGMENTFKAADKAGLDIVGAGLNLAAARKILYKKIGDETLALINCCEKEFSIAGNDDPGCNPLDVVDVCRAISEARSSADYVLVIVHGGVEEYQLPTPRMQKLYRFFIEQGASAVVNHHQHCFSGYEYWQGRPIAYGLGNFCFDWHSERGSEWNKGCLAALDFSSEGVALKLLPYEQCNEEPVVKMLPEDAFDERIEQLNSLIAGSLEEQFDALCARSGKRYLRHFALACPFVSKKKRLKILNDLECESHYERALRSVKRSVK